MKEMQCIFEEYPFKIMACHLIIGHFKKIIARWVIIFEYVSSTVYIIDKIIAELSRVYKQILDTVSVHCLCIFPYQ